MTFDTMAGWQAWTLVAVAGAAALALFLVKLRAPRTLAPALLLWRRVLDDPRELTLWERIRRAVSLVATVVVALLLALAVARPGTATGTADTHAGRLLIVLDSSWSMQAATRTGETRWERAMAEARRVLAGASGREVALATTADGLVEGPTTDASLVDAALDRVVPRVDDRTAWPRLADIAEVHFITDGATARPMPADVVVHSVFDPVPNVAIVAFDVRPTLGDAHAGEAYIEIANFAPHGQRVRLTLTRGAATVFDERLDISASGALRQVVPIAREGDAALRARIDAAEDALAIDNEAVAWIDRARPVAVTAVGTDLDWLERALRGHPDVDAHFVDPSAFDALTSDARDRVDAFVFDGWAPASPPDRPALLFAPPPTDWLSGSSDRATHGGAAVAPPGEERRPRWSQPASHPVLLGVDPYTLVIDRARPYSSPDLTPIARSDRGTPLVYTTGGSGPRAVVVAFSPGESNLLSAPGFPVLLANALDWLARPSALLTGATPSSRPGLIDFDPDVLGVTGPDGRTVPLVRAGERSVGWLAVPGLYAAHGSGFQTMLAINAGDPELSNLARTTVTGAAPANQVGTGRSGRPWWMYVALAAFALVSVEWWTWQRRITV